MRSPSRSASSRRFRTSIATPSLMAMPSAVESNVRQRPRGDSACALVKHMKAERALHRVDAADDDHVARAAARAPEPRGRRPPATRRRPRRRCSSRRRDRSGSRRGRPRRSAGSRRTNLPSTPAAAPAPPLKARGYVGRFERIAVLEAKVAQPAAEAENDRARSRRPAPSRYPASASACRAASSDSSCSESIDVQRRGRNAVLHRIERHVLEEAAPARVDLVARAALRVIEQIDVEAIRRDLGDGVHLVEDVRPEGGRVGRFRQQRTESDNRDIAGSRGNLLLGRSAPGMGIVLAGSPCCRPRRLRAAPTSGIQTRAAPRPGRSCTCLRRAAGQPRPARIAVRQTSAFGCSCDPLGGDPQPAQVQVLELRLISSAGRPSAASLRLVCLKVS